MGLPGNADVAELVDALDLGSSAERRGGSSPFIRTTLSEALAKGGPEPSTLSGAKQGPYARGDNPAFAHPMHLK